VLWSINKYLNINDNYIIFDNIIFKTIIVRLFISRCSDLSRIIGRVEWIWIRSFKLRDISRKSLSLQQNIYILLYRFLVRNFEKSSVKYVTEWVAHRSNSRCDYWLIDCADYTASLVLSHGLYLLCRVSSAYTRARTRTRTHAHISKCKSDVDVTRPYMANRENHVGVARYKLLLRLFSYLLLHILPSILLRSSNREKNLYAFTDWLNEKNLGRTGQFRIIKKKKLNESRTRMVSWYKVNVFPIWR